MVGRGRWGPGLQASLIKKLMRRSKNGKDGAIEWRLRSSLSLKSGKRLVGFGSALSVFFGNGGTTSNSRTKNGTFGELRRRSNVVFGVGARSVRGECGEFNVFERWNSCLLSELWMNS